MGYSKRTLRLFDLGEFNEHGLRTHDRVKVVCGEINQSQREGTMRFFEKQIPDPIEDENGSLLYYVSMRERLRVFRKDRRQR